jgi:hypothetical protein
MISVRFARSPSPVRDTGSRMPAMRWVAPEISPRPPMRRRTAIGSSVRALVSLASSMTSLPERRSAVTLPVDWAVGTEMPRSESWL